MTTQNSILVFMSDHRAISNGKIVYRDEFNSLNDAIDELINEGKYIIATDDLVEQLDEDGDIDFVEIPRAEKDYTLKDTVNDYDILDAKELAEIRKTGEGHIYAGDYEYFTLRIDSLNAKAINAIRRHLDQGEQIYNDCANEILNAIK